MPKPEYKYKWKPYMTFFSKGLGELQCNKQTFLQTAIVSDLLLTEDNFTL